MYWHILNCSNCAQDLLYRRWHDERRCHPAWKVLCPGKPARSRSVGPFLSESLAPTRILPSLGVCLLRLFVVVRSVAHTVARRLLVSPVGSSSSTSRDTDPVEPATGNTLTHESTQRAKSIHSRANPHPTVRVWRSGPGADEPTATSRVSTLEAMHTIGNRIRQDRSPNC